MTNDLAKAKNCKVSSPALQTKSKKITCPVIALLLSPLLICVTEGVNYFLIFHLFSIIMIFIEVKTVKPKGNKSCENVYEEGVTYFGKQVSTFACNSWNTFVSLSVHLQQKI